ncbi:MAG: hypothetical protein HC927_02570 [Deltaproteobacteria bacterium]|nr:hypothetical protein [Deltaproteobacteria bacterium]
MCRCTINQRRVTSIVDEPQAIEHDVPSFSAAAQLVHLCCCPRWLEDSRRLERSEELNLMTEVGLVHGSSSHTASPKYVAGNEVVVAKQIITTELDRHDAGGPHFIIYEQCHAMCGFM